MRFRRFWFLTPLEPQNPSVDTSKTPCTLIFRYLALHSMSRYLCGHFVQSKTDYGVFSTRIKGPTLETRRSKVIRPVPSESQSSAGHQLPGV